MVPYNKDREPSIWQWAGSSVAASIVLDHQHGTTFTNLDEISGKVVLRCAKPVNVTAIVVKLEGESRTRLLGQRAPGPSPRDDPKVTLEHHKILYKVLNVFPPADVAGFRSNGKGVFTLPAGTHEYAWKFKIPFNNACHTPPTTVPGVHFGMSSQGLEVTREATSHVKKTLPPTLTGFPGEAEISYFVKATIARQGLLKENPRAFAPFNFLPVEPIRPGSTGSQIYARQRHDFSSNGEQMPKKGKMKSFFGGSATMLSSGDAPSLSIDIRLPEPAIITCMQTLPLSIVVKKLNAATGMVYLQSLQVALIGYTKVKAHEFERVEQNSWIIVSKSNMQTPLGSVSDPEGTDVSLDSNLWQASPLPNTVAPSFETCNISRHYQIDVRVGLGYGGSLGSAAKPQTIILPLRLDTLVFSGIAPPAQVLARIGITPTRKPVATEHGDVKNDIVDPATLPTQPAPSVPPRPAEEAGYGEAPPPSYEDAIAEDLPPIDGYRPAYAPPPAEQDSLLHRNEKR